MAASNREAEGRAARKALAIAAAFALYDRDSCFYRPAKLPDPRPGTIHGQRVPEQLRLNFPPQLSW
jgi:hypothetical protein